MARSGPLLVLACACVLQTAAAFTPVGPFSPIAAGVDGKKAGRDVRPSVGGLRMGKGKSQVPITQRGEMKKREDMQRQPPATPRSSNPAPGPSLGIAPINRLPPAPKRRLARQRGRSTASAQSASPPSFPQDA
ncbi:hypothetical protein T484DRAFT_1755998 [Baffinella frigidus]|nr:hypothetical protein T484DRAFT_1755998 [Cryptophyta sp. CCMP2293]